MGFSLRLIKETIEKFDTCEENKEEAISTLELAIDAINRSLCALDGISVKGRQSLDTLLGCMMALDAIIGKEEVNGE